MFRLTTARFTALLPQHAFDRLDWLRSAAGASIGIAAAATITMMLLGGDRTALPWLVAPMGASAVLIFAVPASPLAQPWSVIGGNLFSAAIGLAFGLWTGSPALAASLAVGTAIAAMIFARCLHPPGGACALLCALGAAGADGWSWPYLWPIAANVLALSLAGFVFNNATGHKWPHRAPASDTAKAQADMREDIEAVLAEWDEVLDVDIDDLHALLQATNARAARRTA